MEGEGEGRRLFSRRLQKAVLGNRISHYFTGLVCGLFIVDLAAATDDHRAGQSTFSSCVSCQ